MSERLAAAAARAEQEQAARQAAAAASSALTSVVPAINHPALTFAGRAIEDGPAGDGRVGADGDGE